MSESKQAFQDDDIREFTYDDSIAGKYAEADGGSHVPGTNFAARQSFAGRLTGRRMTQGNPPWRFLEIGEFTEKPEGFTHEMVWCHEDDVYIDTA